MQNKTFCVQRVARLSALNNRHNVYDKNRLIACVCCNGNRDYSYTLYDESQEERVQTFIRRLDKQRNTMYSCECYIGDVPSVIWPLVA